MDIFKIRLKRVISESGKSLCTIAKECGLSTSRLSDYTSDKKGPNGGITSANLIILAKYFNVSTDWLLGLSEVRTRDPKLEDVQMIVWRMHRTIGELQHELLEVMNACGSLDVWDLFERKMRQHEKEALARGGS